MEEGDGPPAASAGCARGSTLQWGVGSTMSGTSRARSTRHTRHLVWHVIHRTAAVSAMLFLVAEIAAIAVSTVRPGQARAATAPTGQNFTITPGDLHFIMKQIKIAERHSATLTASNPCGTLVGPDANQIPDRLTPYGLRTVDGSCNNLFPSREKFAAADQPFPRLTSPVFRDAETSPPGFGPSHPTSYKQVTTGNMVFDSQPRVISNLVVDQT